MAGNPDGVKAIVRAFEPYHAWVKTLIVLNLIGWGIFELWTQSSAVYGFALTPDGRWIARTLVWSALLLFDNLVVIWWYADSASKQHRLAETTRGEANRPFAVVDCKRVADTEQSPGAQTRYVIRNVGPGLAVNVFYAVDEDAGLAIRALGALEGRGERTLPDGLEQPLRNARGATHVFVMVAEGIASQVGRWTVTINALLPSGEVAHRFVVLDHEKRTDSLRTWLEWHWPTLKTQLSILENQR